MNIKSVVRLSGVDKNKVFSFIESWKKVVDLPCEQIKFNEIDETTLELELFYGLDIFDHSVTQFVTVLFGELSFITIFGKIRFVDLELPKEVYEWFSGPKFGVEEIKEKFGLSEYPMLVAIVKPSLGKQLTLEQLQVKIEQVLGNGFHAIKDDEMQGDLKYAPQEKRIDFARKYYKYIPTLNYDTLEKYKKTLTGKDAEKIGMVLINASTIGFQMLHEISKISQVPILSHNALQGVYNNSFSPKVFAILHRLFGCDAYISPIGEAGYYNVTKGEEKEMVKEFTKKLPIKQTLPILTGGARLHNLQEIILPYEKTQVPYGLAFGSLIFASEKNPAQMAKLTLEKIKEIKKIV